MKRIWEGWFDLITDTIPMLGYRSETTIYPSQTREERCKESRASRRWRMLLLTGAIFFFLWFAVQGCQMLLDDIRNNFNIEEFERALRKKDIFKLQMLIRVQNPEIKINKETLQPLFSYFETHPNGYKKLRNDLEKQLDMKKVYIHGLTSEPPVFSIRVYEQHYSLRDQYVFEPTLYTVHADIEGKNVSILVNGKEIMKTETERFSNKIGIFLPGLYEITIVKDEEGEERKETKEIVLFGGQRTRHIDFTDE